MTSPSQAPIEWSEESRPNKFNMSPKWARAGGELVVEDLLRFGPEQSIRVSQSEANSYCWQLTKSHYENFSVASWLVPRRLRQHVANVYAFCRWADDLSDEISSSDQSLQLLSWWSSSLRECYQGATIHPVFVALKTTIDEFGIPIHPFQRLIDAFCQDQTTRRYQRDEELYDYCHGSANPVGEIMLYLDKPPSHEQIRFSDSICTGLQIANFCQDVRRDAEMNRIYFPQEHWHRFGLDEESILTGSRPQPLKDAVRFWSEQARQRLCEGLPLVRTVGSWLARDIQLFARGGIAILDAIAKKKYDVWNHSIEVSNQTKLALMLRACLAPRSLSNGIAERL